MRVRTWLVGVFGLSLVLALSLGAPRARAVPGAQPAARSGAEVFAANCQICHGPSASGRIGPPLNQIPPEIKALPRDAVIQELTGLIRGGIPGRMPMFTPELVSDAEVGPLVDYLFSLDGSLPGPSVYEALAPVTAESAQGRTFFPETSHSVGGDFLTYWRRNGGLERFGFPISEEYNGVSPIDGKVYRMQLFERARMELHPELPAGRQVLLALLGVEEARLRMHFLGER
ncbi:MAG TPA: cytochrome c [Roseiflexaceae bacterium]|nr:cytochrome c [Roseiflexaceae bacterium]